MTAEHEDRIHDALRSAASAAPIDDAWDVVRTRALTGEVDGAVVHVDRAPRSERAVFRIALVAAAALLLVAGVAALVNRNRAPSTGVRTRAASSTTTAPNRAGPRTTTSDAHRSTDRYDDLTGLQFSLELDATTVTAGDTISGTLVVKNTTDHQIGLTECTRAETRFGLVPEDQQEAPLPKRSFLDCTGTAVIQVTPHDTDRLDIGAVWGPHDGFVARNPATSTDGGDGEFRGSLSPGRYRAVVSVPGSTSTVHLVGEAVRVKSQVCGGIPDELPQQILGFPGTTPLATVERSAERLGYDVREVERDGRDLGRLQSLRCSRINVAVESGAVTRIVDLG